MASLNGEDDEDWGSLSSRPGFLIRRLHQIHVALFFDECGAEDITPVQFSLLSALETLGASDQSAIGRMVALDRATVADVLERLELRRFISRKPSAADRRVRIVSLTALGRSLLRRVEGGAVRAHERTIEALPPSERRRFVRSLKRLADANNEAGRAPLKLG